MWNRPNRICALVAARGSRHGLGMNLLQAPDADGIAHARREIHRYAKVCRVANVMRPYLESAV